jgi:hypothetical protein
MRAEVIVSLPIRTGYSKPAFAAAGLKSDTTSCVKTEAIRIGSFISIPAAY